MTKQRKSERLVQWFGSATDAAPEVGKLLAGCRMVYLPFCGGCSEVPWIDAKQILCNDLHWHLINLCRIVANDDGRKWLANEADKLPYHPEALQYAQGWAKFLGNDVMRTVPNREAALHYFVAVWMGRGGKAGTASELSGGLPIRWNANGGGSNRRYRTAIEALESWGETFRRCEFTCMDAFDFLAKCQDEPMHGIYCLLPGSQVRMADERIVDISSVKTGDIVAPGRTVRGVFNRSYEGDALQIKVQGVLEPLIVTADHPIPCIKKSKTRKDSRDRRSNSSRWKNRTVEKASSLERGDWLLIPTDGIEQVGQYVNPNYSRNARGGGPQPRQINIKYSKSFFRYLGYYASEGHLSGDKGNGCCTVTLSFGRHETDTHASDAARCLFESTGLQSVIDPGRPHATVTSVRTCSVALGRAIHSLIPGLAKKKRLTDALMTARVSLQRELLIGWLRGDGGIDAASESRCRLTGTSSSKELATQMYQIAMRCGLRPSLRKRLNKASRMPQGNMSKDSIAYDVVFASTDAKSLGWSVNPKADKSHRKLVNNHILAKITKIERFEYRGPVFNLQVDGDHTFCAPFVLVHNCDANWPDLGDGYVHSIDETEQRKLASALGLFQKARAVVRFGEHPLIRSLYLPEFGWIWRPTASRNQANDVNTEFLITRNL